MLHEIPRYSVQVCQPAGSTGTESTFASVTLPRPPWEPEPINDTTAAAVQDAPKKMRKFKTIAEAIPFVSDFLTEEPEEVICIIRIMREANFFITTDIARKALIELYSAGLADRRAHPDKPGVSYQYFLPIKAS